MMSIRTHSGIYTLEVKRFMKISANEAWDFFSSPSNLSNITPEHMGFNITSLPSGVMYPGQIITYKVSPFPGYTTNWVTEITHVSEGLFFVDEQRFGPYKMWHHEHHFETLRDGVLMTDRVSYKLPFGIFGRLAHTLFVRKQLKQIFEYREECLDNIFGKK
jgi:ligand-binding SRPBCC domain-containing protein